MPVVNVPFGLSILAFGAPKTIEAKTEAEAIALAIYRFKGHAWEIWDDVQLVGLKGRKARAWRPSRISGHFSRDVA
jgi:hypothetical protein